MFYTVVHLYRGGVTAHDYCTFGRCLEEFRGTESSVSSLSSWREYTFLVMLSRSIFHFRQSLSQVWYSPTANDIIIIWVNISSYFVMCQRKRTLYNPRLCFAFGQNIFLRVFFYWFNLMIEIPSIFVVHSRVFTIAITLICQMCLIFMNCEVNRCSLSSKSFVCIWENNHILNPSPFTCKFASVWQSYNEIIFCIGNYHRYYNINHSHNRHTKTLTYINHCFTAMVKHTATKKI